MRGRLAQRMQSTTVMHPYELKVMPGKPGRARLLVVDDEPVVCESCRRILSASGYQVETCTDSSTGLRLAEQNDYDAILLDIRMPFISGVRFLERLREVDAHVPVILISGYGMEAAKASASHPWVSEYVPKPFTPAEVSAAVKRSLGWRPTARDEVART